MSFIGVLLGLRCASRAHAGRRLSRLTWLVLGGVAAGGLGAWAMDFIGLLGFTIRGEIIHYNVLVTVESLAAAVATMCVGLLVAEFGQAHSGWLVAGGLITGFGLAVAHYLAMAAMRTPAQVAYEPVALIGSVVIAIAAATATLWAAVRVRPLWRSVLAALVLAVVISGMHYTAMAAVRLYQGSGTGTASVASSAGSVTSQALLTPLIIGIALVTFLVGAIIALSPTADAISYDQSLLDDIRRRSQESLEATPLPPPPTRKTGNGTAAHSSPPWTFTELRRPKAQPEAQPVAQPARPPRGSAGGPLPRRRPSSLMNRGPASR